MRGVEDKQNEVDPSLAPPACVDDEWQGGTDPSLAPPHSPLPTSHSPLPTPHSPLGWIHVGLYGIGLLAALALFLNSGTGQWLVQRKARPEEQQFAPMTPVALTRELESKMATMVPLRVFDSGWWNDYLLWKLPQPARVYWYSHWNCFSAVHANDGHRLMELRPPPNDWRTIVNRHRINALVLQAETPPKPLFQHLLDEENIPEEDREWRIICREDNGPAAGVVAVRRVILLSSGWCKRTWPRGASVTWAWRQLPANGRY